MFVVYALHFKSNENSCVHAYIVYVTQKNKLFCRSLSIHSSLICKVIYYENILDCCCFYVPAKRLQLGDDTH